MILRQFIKILCLSIASLWAVSAYSWTLVPEESSVHFVSVKKENVGEVHHFTIMSGKVDESGKAELAIQLASVETAIPIRNERLQSELFETALFPVAEISASVDMNLVAGLSPGQTLVQKLPLTLSLHGIKQTQEALIKVVKLDDQSVLVYSLAPVIVKAADFQLVAGIEKLRELADLPSITQTVPVTVSLLFKQ